MFLACWPPHMWPSSYKVATLPASTAPGKLTSLRTLLEMLARAARVSSSSVTAAAASSFQWASPDTSWMICAICVGPARQGMLCERCFLFF